MQHESPMLKTVGASGQLTLGKKYSGRHFELEGNSQGGRTHACACAHEYSSQKRSRLTP
jgi:hypothetical protein